MFMLTGALGALAACDLLVPEPSDPDPTDSGSDGTTPDEPPAITPAETALPVFLGITERSAAGVVTVSTMAEFEASFGAPPPNDAPFALDTSLRLYFANGGTEAQVVSVGTFEAVPTVEDYTAGLDALASAGATDDTDTNDTDEATLVLMPDAAATLAPDALHRVQQEALAHCHTHGRFCLLDLQDDLPGAVARFRSELDPVGGPAIDGAAYLPWVVGQRRDGTSVSVPPSGVMAGIYVRVDREEGVWKAPANVELSGVSALTSELSRDEREILVAGVDGGVSINPLIAFPTGVVPWGTRTLAGNDNEWRYVPVRRTARFLERSMLGSLDWVVLEPNDEPLWSQIRVRAEAFLGDLWRQGAFAGEQADEAYFVRVGLGETMTEADVDAGRVIVQVGFAPVRPAEFVILTLEPTSLD